MLFRQIIRQYSKPTKLSFVVCLLAGVIFPLNASFRDHLPLKSPSSIFSAENTIDPQYTECRNLRAGENAKAYSLNDIYATYASAKTTPYGYAFSTCKLITNTNHHCKSFLSFFSDLSPPIA